MRPSLLSLLVLSLTPAFAQQTSQPPAHTCGEPPATLQSTAPNLFSEQQEQWLGEAMRDQSEGANRPVRNPAENAYLQVIGARLLAALPPTALKFRFTLVESADINGFSLAGGNVYLTRKLVASTRNEDEVATVIAHEMGHILTHQFAIETTADLRRLLGITSISDRADIYAKYQRLLDAKLHEKHPADPDSDAMQDQADRVAVYAAANAGYRPQAYAEFWDRSFFVKGKTGNGFTDFFGATKPSEKRLRKLRGIIAELPAGCGSATDTASAAFTQWQHMVLENQAIAPSAANASSAPDASASKSANATTPTAPTTASTEGLQLTPPLRLDIDRLRFSRDGKYILAQDESSIFVLSRQPFKQLFRFDADHAYPAEFSPDSQSISFYTPGLHVETWSVAGQRLTSAHEVNVQQNCLQTWLAPDGLTLACVSFPDYEPSLRVQLIDVVAGNVVLEKKNWFQPNYNIELEALIRRYNNDSAGVIASALSADGNTLLMGPGADRLAFDLRTRTQIKIAGALRSYDYPNTYCFSGNDRVYLMNTGNPDGSGVFSFPAGERLKQFKFSLRYMRSTSGGEFVVTDGPKDAAVGVADLNAGKLVYASRASAVDVFGNSYVGENADGSLDLAALGEKEVKDHSSAKLTLSPLAQSRSLALSPDGTFLAISTHTRGAAWNLQTGKQAFLVRGFQGAAWTPDGKLLAHFPEFDKKPEAIAQLSLNPLGAKNLTYKLPENAALVNNHLLAWKSEKKASTLTSYSPLDASVQWSRNFDEGRPGFTTNDGDEDLIFSYPIASPLGKEKLKADPALRSQADAIKQKKVGRLIEIVNSADGAVRASVVVEVPLTYEGVDGFNRVGDLLYLSVGDNRTIVYSLQSGAQLRQLFGFVAAADQPSQTICIANRRDEAIVLDRAGAELLHLTLDNPIRFAALREKGTQLLLLTADQRIHRYPVPSKLTLTSSAPSPRS